MPTSVRLRRFFVPASIGLILIFAVGWYNFFWLPSRHRYLDDRNFRVLKTLSEQIRLNINNLDKMMDNAAEFHITKDELPGYFSKVAPQLQKPAKEETDSFIGKNDYDDPPRIAVVPDEGTHFLYMAFKRSMEEGKSGTQHQTVDYAIRTDLDKLIRNFLPPSNRDPFNIVLVAREDGTVIFQKSSPGIEVARIDAFEDESAVTSGKKSEEARAGKQVLESKKLTQSSRYAEVTVAGAQYRLYSQPLQLSFQGIDPAARDSKTQAPKAPAEKWILCGLVRADAFRAESQSMSYTYMLWLSVAILLAIAAYPFLKLHLSSPIERLRGRDVVTIAGFACIVAAAVTFIFIDVYYWRYDFDHKAGEHMKALADAIDGNFGDEKQKAFEQLQNFYDKDGLSRDLQATKLRTSPLPLFTAKGECSPKEACRTNILKDSKDKVEQYPYLLVASWSDRKGNQQIKWTTKASVTPFLNLNSLGYYSEVKAAFSDVNLAFAHRGSPISAAMQGVGSEYSSNTGENITIFWKLFDVWGNAVTGAVPVDPKDVFCASLVVRPISVVGPVLPAGFQFAVIKSDGTVLFHSDRTRNLRENFLDETDQNQEVRSRVLMRASGPLVTNYMGRPHRLYLSPMIKSGQPSWTVVVFRDLRVEDSMNLEMLSLASIMFLLYVSAIALGLLLLYCRRRGRITGTWLWPDSRKARTYRWLAIGNGVAGFLMLLMSQLPAFFALLFCAFVIPMGAIGCNLWLLRRHGDGSIREVEADREDGASSRWQLHYLASCATLLAVVAVLPCICFAKVACDFEHKLMVARSQLGLAADIDERKASVRRDYQSIDVGNFGKQLLVAPGDQLAEPEEPPARLEPKTTPYFSYHQILRTSINSTQDQHHFEPATCSLSDGESRQRCVDLFLGWSSPLYDQLSVNNQFMAESSSSGARAWSSTIFGSDQDLELKTLEADGRVRKINSVWIPLHIPWTDWHWWLGGVALMAALLGLVWWSLQRIFLLDVVVPPSPENVESVCDPSSLIAKLSMNLLVIGPRSSSVVADLINRQEVQAWDMQDMLNAAQRYAKTADGASFVTSSSGDQVEEIIRDGRPLVLYNCETTFASPRTNHQSLLALQRVISNLGSKVVITTALHPESQAPLEENERWATLLQSFVRIDVNSSSAQRVDENPEQFESRLSAEAFERWLFPRRSRPQKLVLVHLAQEGLVNPNSQGIVQELIKEGVVVRRSGLLAIKDSRLAEFVKSAVPSDSIKHWEGQGAGTRSASLRTSLLVVAAGIAGFLIYTQGDVFNTWVTYATGLAASVPAFIKVIAMFRGKGGAEA